MLRRALAAAPRLSPPARRRHRAFHFTRVLARQVFSRVAIVWGAQDPLYKYPFTPFPKPKGCELTLETGPECTEERNQQVMSRVRTQGVYAVRARDESDQGWADLQRARQQAMELAADHTDPHEAL